MTALDPVPIGAIVQTLLETQEGVSRLFEHPHVPCVVKGAGDYFAARLTGHCLLGMGMPQAVERACGDTAEQLTRTRRLGWEEMAIHTIDGSVRP